MDDIKNKLLSMEIGLDFKSKNKIFTRLNNSEWVMETSGEEWSIAYLDVDTATAYLEGKVNDYELDWE